MSEVVRPILTADEYRRIDKGYEGDLDQAMEEAGYAVALAAVRAGATYGAKVVVLAGPGNNGGDGYVAARYLKARGASVTVHAFGMPQTGEAQRAASIAGVSVVELSDPFSVDVVVDALFGGGMRNGIPKPIRAWMSTDAPVVAVDFPTGLDPHTGAVGDVAFRAVETVTFSSLKTSHVRGPGLDYCGKVTVVDIGINGGEPSMYVAEESDARRPSRARQAHKWSAGSVLVVGGSRGIVGASVLAGKSALRFGAGSVVVATPQPETVHNVTPELPTISAGEALERLDRFDVVLAGPGLNEPDADLFEPILAKASRLVLDAGALTPRLLEVAKQNGAEIVMTPHDAEFLRVSAVVAGSYSCRAFATRHGLTVLRKGNPTMITDGCAPILVNTGGPELASIGTGDVLAGMVAALWARGLSGIEAATSAAYWHGLAGAELTVSGTVTADRLVDSIGAYAW